MMDELVRALHEYGYTLVLKTARGDIQTFTGRGVADLFRMVKEKTGILEGAMVADKVVGKGAAALMILGGVAELHTDVLSEAARNLLDDSDVEYSFDELVPKIWNRNHTGGCPVENLCKDALTAAACFPLIEKFVESMRKK